MKKLIVRTLIVCFTVASFQAQAGLIGTGDVAGAVAQAQEARTLLVTRLHAFGIARDTATDRVAALSDAEAVKLAGQVEAAPAGADGVTFGILFVVLFLFWRFVLSDQAKAESAARDKADKK
jgi:hypothetical protein